MHQVLPTTVTKPICRPQPLPTSHLLSTYLKPYYPERVSSAVVTGLGGKRDGGSWGRLYAIPGWKAEPWHQRAMHLPGEPLEAQMEDTDLKAVQPNSSPALPGQTMPGRCDSLVLRMGEELARCTGGGGRGWFSGLEQKTGRVWGNNQHRSCLFSLPQKSLLGKKQQGWGRHFAVAVYCSLRRVAKALERFLHWSGLGCCRQLSGGAQSRSPHASSVWEAPTGRACKWLRQCKCTHQLIVSPYRQGLGYEKQKNKWAPVEMALFFMWSVGFYWNSAPKITLVFAFLNKHQTTELSCTFFFYS